MYNDYRRKQEGFIRCSENRFGQLLIGRTKYRCDLKSSLSLNDLDIKAIFRAIHDARGNRFGAFWLKITDSEFELLIQVGFDYDDIKHVIVKRNKKNRKNLI